jgi:TPP-dependent pyruvate/acetoin dehydrogenase alpha subunit
MTPRKKRPGMAPAPPPGESGFSLISDKKMVALYTAMVKCRLLERHLRAERLCALPRTPGREAVAAGVAIDLRAGDRISAADGGVLPGFVKEGSVQAVLAKLGAGSTPAGNVARLPEAIATAQELKRRKTGDVVVLFCGLTSVPARLLRGAAAERLPILFVCGNQRASRNLAAMADGCGLPGITVDCEDAVALYRVASEALAHARRGNGPTLIECRRWLLASGKKSMRRGDAVRTMERSLAGKGLWTKKLREETVAQFARELDKTAIPARAGAH